IFARHEPRSHAVPSVMPAHVADEFISRRQAPTMRQDEKKRCGPEGGSVFTSGKKYQAAYWRRRSEKSSSDLIPLCWARWHQACRSANSLSLDALELSQIRARSARISTRVASTPCWAMTLSRSLRSVASSSERCSFCSNWLSGCRASLLAGEFFSLAISSRQVAFSRSA